jgi:hypothetical protein
MTAQKGLEDVPETGGKGEGYGTAVAFGKPG